MPARKNSPEEVVNPVDAIVVEESPVEIAEEVVETPLEVLVPEVVVSDKLSNKKPAVAKKAEVVEEVVDSPMTGGKFVKVHFVQDHTFSIGVQKHEMKKGDRMQVELYIANTLSERKIAYIIG